MQPDDSAEILVVVGYGRVPEKIAKRIPIGLALTYASLWMSPANAAQANRLAAQGLVTWINYPELGKPRGTYDHPTVSLDGNWLQLEGALAVDLEAKRAWDDARGAVVASAITRMVARVRRTRRTRGVGRLVPLASRSLVCVSDPASTASSSRPVAFNARERSRSRRTAGASPDSRYSADPRAFALQDTVGTRPVFGVSAGARLGGAV
jgi:hypothetical protein